MNVWRKVYLHGTTTFRLDKGEGKQRVLEQMLLTVDGEMLYTDAMDETYRSKRNVFSACHYHVVWRPKYRRTNIAGLVDQELFRGDNRWGTFEHRQAVHRVAKACLRRHTTTASILQKSRDASCEAGFYVANLFSLVASTRHAALRSGL
jgi:hypothetical protein